MFEWLFNKFRIHNARKWAKMTEAERIERQKCIDNHPAGKGRKNK